MKQIFLCLFLVAALAGCGNDDSKLTITTTLPEATIGTAYYQTLFATGDTAPYTWIVTSGTLPTGLTLSTAGVLSGTPASACSAFVVSVYGASTSTMKSFTIKTILPAGTPGISLASGQSIMVPDGTTVTDINLAVTTVSGHDTTTTTTAGSIVHAPATDTGPADNIVVAK